MRPIDRGVFVEPRSRSSRGVFVIFSLQFFSAIAFSIVFSLLVLYLLLKLKLPQVEAYTLVAAYNALGYATSILGCYLAERFLGYRFAILISTILGSAGLIILTIQHVVALYLGLACFSMSYGIMIPAIFVLLGRLHTVADAVQRDHSFIIAYIAMDAGAFLAAMLSGYISIYFGYSMAFAIGAICFLITLFIFLRHQKLFSVTPAKEIERYYYVKNRNHSRCCGVGLILLSLPILVILLEYANICNILLIFLGVGCLFFVVYFASLQKNSYSGKLLVFLVLLTISTIFDASYFLSPSALTVFTDSTIDKHIFGVSIPTATYSALNPFFIVTVGPAMSYMWSSLSKRGKLPSFPARFAMATILMGCGYLVLMYGTEHHDAKNYVSAWWLAGGFFLQTVGELMISPAGYAMVGIFVPAPLEGIMMGISQFSSGVSGALSGFMANWISPPTGDISKAAINLWYQHAFGYVGIIAILIGLLAFCLTPYLIRLSNRDIHYEKSSSLLETN